MEEMDVRRIMILIALITPLIAGLMIMVGKMTAQDEAPMPRRMLRNLLLLAAAGPVNLVLWYLLNGVLQGVGSRSVIGCILAAVVFIAGGFTTGFFSRLKARGTGETDGEEK